MNNLIKDEEQMIFLYGGPVWVKVMRYENKGNKNEIVSIDSKLYKFIKSIEVPKIGGQGYGSKKKKKSKVKYLLVLILIIFIGCQPNKKQKVGDQYNDSTKRVLIKSAAYHVVRGFVYGDFLKNVSGILLLDSVYYSSDIKFDDAVYFTPSNTIIKVLYLETKPSIRDPYNEFMRYFLIYNMANDKFYTMFRYIPKPLVVPDTVGAAKKKKDEDDIDIITIWMLAGTGG